MHSPHRRYNAPESHELHGGRQVDRLVRLARVAFGRLARAQEGKERVWEVEAHEACYCQPPVSQRKSGLERAVRVLLAVARKVDQGCGGEEGQNV